MTGQRTARKLVRFVKVFHLVSYASTLIGWNCA